MGRLAIITISIVMMALAVRGQTIDLLPGYVVVVGGDTIRGYLNPGPDPWNLEQLELWQNRDSRESRRFMADELTGFSIVTTDERYVRRSMRVERTPENLPPQQRLPRIQWREKTVFLRVLVEGSLELYSYHDTKWHFFTGSGEDLKELINIEYRPFGYNNTKLYKLYMPQLDSMTADCRKEPPKAILYNERPIVERVTRYNQCRSSLHYVRTRGKPYFNATLLVGQSNNQVSYTGISNTAPISAQFYAASASFTSTSSMPIGGSFDFSLRRKAKLKLNMELMHRPSTQFTASNGETDPLKVRRDYFIEIGYTGLNVGFKTRIVRGRSIQVYLQGDYSITLSTQLRTYEILNMQSSSSLTLEPMSDFSTSGTGFVAGVQVTYWRFSMLARWETISFQSSSSGVSQDSFSALLGISLFR